MEYTRACRSLIITIRSFKHYISVFLTKLAWNSLFRSSIQQQFEANFSCYTLQITNSRFYCLIPLFRKSTSMSVNLYHIKNFINLSCIADLAVQITTNCGGFLEYRFTFSCMGSFQTLFICSNRWKIATQRNWRSHHIVSIISII